MSRSLYKLPYIHRSLWAKSIKLRLKRVKYTKKMIAKIFPIGNKLERNLFFWKRASMLNNSLIKSNKIIGVYNGFGFLVMHLNKKFFNYKLGQFSVTRRAPLHKGKQKQYKKQVKNQMKKPIKNQLKKKGRKKNRRK